MSFSWEKKSNRIIYGFKKCVTQRDLLNPVVLFQSLPVLLVWFNQLSCHFLKIFLLSFQVLFSFWLFLLPLSSVVQVFHFTFLLILPWVISFSHMIFYTVYKLVMPKHVSPAWTSLYCLYPVTQLTAPVSVKYISV